MTARRKATKGRTLLYDTLAKWWPLCSPPGEYREEAERYHKVILAASGSSPRTLLELGSGGGNNASHLKRHFELTLVDSSPSMLAVSRALNPECEHLRGDMRSVRLRRQFDAVFIHDAIDYMVTQKDLERAVTTAFVHCRPGGVALFVPDWTRERFRPTSSHGGTDAGSRGARYLEWTLDPDPHDGQYTLYMSYLLREGGRVRQPPLDVHVCGLFREREWLGILRRAGFKAQKLTYTDSSWDPHPHAMFLGVRPSQ
jgi:SAM-dependent methyltransferase